MGYCELDDVKARCQRLPMAVDSNPSQAEVEVFIDECSNYLDGVLKPLGYVVPVTTGNSSLKILKKICADGAAFHAMDAAYSGVTPNASEQGEKYRKEWTYAIDRLRRGEMILPDAPVTAGAQGEPRGSGLVSNFSEDDSRNFTPFVKHDEEW